MAQQRTKMLPDAFKFLLTLHIQESLMLAPAVSRLMLGSSIFFSQMEQTLHIF